MPTSQGTSLGDKINSNEDDKSVVSSAATSASELKRDQLIFELVKRRLDNERHRINDLDGKANNLVGFVSVVISVLLGSALFELRFLSLSPAISILYFLGIGVLLLSIGFALGGFRIRKWEDVPEVLYLLDEYTNRPYEEILTTSSVEMAKAVKHAEEQNNHKAQLISWSWYFLIAGLSLLVLFIVLLTATGADTQ
jgi:hypothetical protein